MAEETKAKAQKETKEANEIRDAAVKEKDAVIKEKDAAVKEKDAVVKELRFTQAAWLDNVVRHILVRRCRKSRMRGRQSGER